MKRNMPFILMALTVVIMLMPLCAFGQDYSDYFVLKLGKYTPTGDLDDAGIESGFNGELGFTNYFSKNFSYEFGVGYFKTDDTFTSIIPIIGQVSENDKSTVLPIFLTLKGHITFKIVEFYGGVGVGWYFAMIDIDINTPIGSLSFSDADNVFGLHFLAGINFNITEKWFLGIEAKKFTTGDFNFFDTDLGILDLDFDTNLDGYTISGQIGFRF
jgi:outer membrane protein W